MKQLAVHSGEIKYWTNPRNIRLNYVSPYKDSLECDHNINEADIILDFYIPRECVPKELVLWIDIPTTLSNILRRYPLVAITAPAIIHLTILYFQLQRYFTSGMPFIIYDKLFKVYFLRSRKRWQELSLCLDWELR